MSMRGWMTAVASLDRRAKSPLNLVYITTHTREATTSLYHIWEVKCVCLRVWREILCGKRRISLFDARATSCYVHPPSAAHHQSLQPPYLLLSHFVCALVERADDFLFLSRLARAPKWCGWNCGLVKEKLLRVAREKENPFVVKFGFRFHFMENPAQWVVWSRSGYSLVKRGRTPQENQFSFSNAETTELMDIMFNFLNDYLENLKFYLRGDFNTQKIKKFYPLMSIFYADFRIRTL